MLMEMRMTNDPIKMLELDTLWERNYADGLTWIFKGLFSFILMLVPSSASERVSGFLWYLTLVPVWLIILYIRKKMVYPRMGSVKLRLSPQQNSIRHAWLIVSLVGLPLLMWGIWIFSHDAPGWHAEIWLGLCIASILGTVLSQNYKMWDQKSLYPILEALLIIILLISILISKFDIVWFHLCLMIYGIFNLSAGIYSFIRFIKSNPVLSDE